MIIMKLSIKKFIMKSSSEIVSLLEERLQSIKIEYNEIMEWYENEYSVSDESSNLKDIYEDGIKLDAQLSLLKSLLTEIEK